MNVSSNFSDLRSSTSVISSSSPRNWHQRKALINTADWYRVLLLFVSPFFNVCLVPTAKCFEFINGQRRRLFSFWLSLFGLIKSKTWSLPLIHLLTTQFRRSQSSLVVVIVRRRQYFVSGLAKPLLPSSLCRCDTKANSLELLAGKKVEGAHSFEPITPFKTTKWAIICQERRLKLERLGFQFKSDGEVNLWSSRMRRWFVIFFLRRITHLLTTLLWSGVHASVVSLMRSTSALSFHLLLEPRTPTLGRESPLRQNGPFPLNCRCKLSVMSLRWVWQATTTHHSLPLQCTNSISSAP